MSEDEMPGGEEWDWQEKEAATATRVSVE